uniref:Uncharacterized protein LOC114348998 n=1 Tax=Diabrotica virgifera virgifera TaxID=50390 RepID=A0A6P7H103_DIAVI
MRPFRGNTLAATVILTKQAADSILQRETVKVGIVRCQVEKRIRVPRCNRCWAFDHARDACAGPDRTGTCYGCGTTGHDTESCRAAVRCVLCDEAHGCGSMACPKFRDALKMTRQAEKPKLKKQYIPMPGNKSEISVTDYMKTVSLADMPNVG